tara:strand:- start:19554 stop:19772 length:219 start_codon:yes stop_codon:yes gene_type:complete
MTKNNKSCATESSFWDVLYLSKRLRWGIAISLIISTIYIGAFFLMLANRGCDFEFGWPSVVKVNNCKVLINI